MKQWQVRDVMTREVVTATEDTPVAQIAVLLATHRISAVPIVGAVDRAVGVVSETDLLSKLATGRSAGAPARGRKAAALHARDLMSIRPVTIPADASLAAAAKRMQAKKVRRLLVTGEAGQLVGVVSRADLLRPLTRPDTAISQDIVDHVIRRTLWIDTSQVRVDVADGVATLSGAVGRRTTAAIAARLAATVPGVIAVVDRIRYDFDDTSLARSRVSRTHPFSADPFPP
jgi:CBS-domain-containing membrane protein